MALTQEERKTNHKCQYCGDETLIIYGSRSAGMLRCTNPECESNTSIEGCGFLPQFQDDHGRLIP